jgi:hypothetical protein
VLDFMRVPLPAAKMTTERDIVKTF